MRIIAFAVALFTILPGFSSAQTFGGIGSRAEGMAGAFVAVADDASAIYWNPAGLATGSLLDVHLFGSSESNALVAAAMPALGVSYYRLHTVPGSGSRKNEGSGEVRSGTLSTNNFGITLLQTVVNGLVVGSTARVVSGRIDRFEGRTTFDLDAGVMFAAGTMRFGVAARNLRRAAFRGVDERMPTARAARVGVAYVPRPAGYGPNGPFSIAVDADLTRSADGGEESREVAVGAEYWLPRGLFGVRSGVRWNALRAGNRAISAGFSVKLPYAALAEGHVTKGERDDKTQWGLGGRVAF